MGLLDEWDRTGGILCACAVDMSVEMELGGVSVVCWGVGMEHGVEGA